MQLEPSEPSAQCQRIQVTLETSENSKRMKISLESHDQSLGWYRAASLSIPLHQLPLLEQAINRMRTIEPAEKPTGAKIIPFPGLALEDLHNV